MRGRRKDRHARCSSRFPEYHPPVAAFSAPHPRSLEEIRAKTCAFAPNPLPLHAVWFRSSVGLEQRPSKAWVQGSNPCGITESRLTGLLFLLYGLREDLFAVLGSRLGGELGNYSTTYHVKPRAGMRTVSSTSWSAVRRQVLALPSCSRTRAFRCRPV